MVGAGGIGCELLKDLMLTGYGEIHIVDLDTVTLSNLNRQFLFRQKDIDQSKALTVVKAVEKFNYFNCKLVPHHGNIMDTTAFPMRWWEQFTYIYNALDNLEARRYVNKMCLFLSKPLMESGTTGFEGQIQPIFPYKSECFECNAKETPKTFPVCTIRSTPSKPVHSITWAKEFLFQQLFDDTSTLSAQELEEQRKKLESETDDKQEIETMLNETNELNDLKTTIHTRSPDAIQSMISKIFVKDIERLLQIETLWKTRQKPEPLNYKSFKSDVDAMLSDPDSQHKITKDETRVWTVAENLYVLSVACSNLAERLGKENTIEFDKDDEDTLDFVVAASNLRSFIFHIDTKSKFDVKQIAGNIIPAIATTNAIISGFSAMESLKYFKTYSGEFDQQKGFENSSAVFVSIKPNKYITAASLIEPKPKCPSCKLTAKAMACIPSDMLETMKLEDFIESIKQTYGYEEVSLIAGESRLIYDFDFDDNVDRILPQLGIKYGDTILVQDEDGEKRNVELYIRQEAEFKLMEPSPSDWQTPVAKPEPEPELQPELQPEEEEDVIIVDEDLEVEVVDIEPPTKKQKLV